MSEGKPTFIIDTGAGGLRFLTGARQADPARPISAKPDVLGKVGCAWLCDIEAGCRKLNIRPGEFAHVVQWIIEARWAHLLWSRYLLSVVHLRPCETPRRTLFYLPDATHELTLWALDPMGDDDELQRTGISNGNCLQPVNFAAQFIAQSDDAARARVRETVIDITEGRCSPDTDFRSDWERRFGNNMMKDRPGRVAPIERMV